MKGNFLEHNSKQDSLNLTNDNILVRINHLEKSCIVKPPSTVIMPAHLLWINIRSKREPEERFFSTVLAEEKSCVGSDDPADSPLNPARVPGHREGTKTDF